MTVPPAPPVDDRALLARVAEGDRDAFEALYRLHAGWLTARLQARCGDPDLADIAAQDTLPRGLEVGQEISGEGDVGAWLLGHRHPAAHRRAAQTPRHTH